MPLLPTTPDTEDVKIVQTKPMTLDKIYIDRITIDLDPNNNLATTFTILWSNGYTDPDTLLFVETVSTTSIIRGKDLLVKMQEPVNHGATHYSDFKQSIFELMQQEGILPAGTIG